MTINPSIFKPYDIRGVYPSNFNEEIAYAITQAYIKLYQPKKVVLGRDVRESGESIFNSSLKAFLETGVDVIDIGIVSTDMFYFAVGSLPVDGGITISASHNPREYNGMNFDRKKAYLGLHVKAVEFLSANRQSLVHYFLQAFLHKPGKYY